MDKKKNIALSNLYRFIIAIIIMIFLFRTIDLAKLKHLFKEIDFFWLLLSCLVMIILRFLLTIRLQFILKLNNIRASLKELINVIFISLFFGCIFPSAASADVVRGYQLFKSHGQGTVIMGAIILDRFIGLYSMFFLASIGSLVALSSGISSKIVVFITASYTFITIAWFLFCYLVNKKSLFSFNMNAKYNRFWTRVRTIITATTNMQMIKKSFPFLFAISILTQISRCIMFFCLYKSFGSALNFIYFLVFIPILFIILMLPISFGGLGVREASLIFFFNTIGVTNEVSVSAGVLSQSIQIIISLPFVLPLLSKMIVKNKKDKVLSKY